MCTKYSWLPLAPTTWEAADEGLKILGTAASQVVGAKGNQEYFVHMRAHA